MTKVYLLVGGNLGNRFQLQELAKSLIIKEIGELAGESSFYETQPWGFDHELFFLNKVIAIRTNLLPNQILSKIFEIERILGRKRKIGQQYFERTIDIDILFYGDQIIYEPNLIIPHKQFHNRKFALEPMREISPEFSHPVLHKTINELYSECNDESAVQRVNFTE